MFESNILGKVDKIHLGVIQDLFTQTGSLFILIQQKLERENVSTVPQGMRV